MDKTPEEIAAEAKAQADAEAAAAKVKADADAAAAAKAAAEVRLSQGELDKIAGKARQEGRTAAERELMASLGVDSLDTAKARIQAAQAAEDAQKTELEKATEERNKAVAERERAEQLALNAVSMARLEGALRDAGLKPERIPAAMKLADLSTLKVEGTEVTGVAEAVEALKATSPEWFGANKGGAPDASAPSGTPVDFRTDKEAASRELYEKYGVV